MQAKISTPPATDQHSSVLLFDLPLDGSGAPKFLRQLPALAPPSDQPCTPLDLGAAFKLRGSDWAGLLTLNIDQFKLPFLRNDTGGKEQAIQLSLPPPTPPAPGEPSLPPGTFKLNFGDSTVKIPVAATVKLGTLSFVTELGFVFNWETFGIDVGNSSVDIFLSFAERDGGLTLLESKAVLRGNKLLKCKSTRFEFSIDQIGISFVHEGQFHLYFTLTGRAQFRLADGDDREGLLALLPNITIEMVDCPLAGDVRVLAKHIRFLITLPRPKSFNLLGCFELELRGFGFLPQAEMFDGDAAMWLSGQVKFAECAGDSKNDKVDFHSLYIGVPAPGGIYPRLHFEQIAVDVKIADAFQLYAMVKYDDTPTARGFSGKGVLRVAGLPKFEAAFAFLRVRSTDRNAWVRAWFIYAQASEPCWPSAAI